MSDLIDRQAAIDAPERFTKDCNPEHFVGHQNFIEYMDNAEIGSFGNWQFANGFNMGLTAAEVAIKVLPSAQHERKTGKWVATPSTYHYCSLCRMAAQLDYYGNEVTSNFCPNCGARMEVDDDCT